MKLLALAIALCVMLLGRPLLAQNVSQAADHEALRKLKTDVITAINTRNVQSMDTLLHKPFMSTLITQDSFTDIERLKAYFDGLFTRPVLRINKITMEADPDESAQIYTGTFAVARSRFAYNTLALRLKQRAGSKPLRKFGSSISDKAP